MPQPGCARMVTVSRAFLSGWGGYVACRLNRNRTWAALCLLLAIRLVCILEDVSLRRPSTLTAARMEANRRNAQKSTGPRTARGKAQSRLNGLRGGGRSRLYRDLMEALYSAPPCAVDRTARAILSPEQAVHPLFADLVDMFRQAEIEVVLEYRRLYQFADA